MITERLNLNDFVSYEDDDLIIRRDKSIRIECKYNTVFGLGERYNSINHISKKVLNVVEEKFCNQGEKSYFPLPFFMLDNGYGFFIKTKQTVEFVFEDIIEINNPDIKNDEMIILKGSYKEMISDFIELTGAIKKAPKWIFGPWISAHRWNSQKMVEDVREKLKELSIPVTALVLEQWSDEATFYIFNGSKYPEKEYLVYEDFDFSESPWYDPKYMIDELHREGIRLLLWQCPVVKKIPADEPYNRRHENDWNRCISNNLTVSKAKEAYFIPEGNWFNGSMIPDFTNDETIDWWFKNRQYLMDIGVDGFKTDGGEFIHSEVINHIKETEKELKNNYSLEYAKAYSEFVGNDKVTFSRAGYTGQQSYSLMWAGDQKSTFEELQSIYRAGINASLCGQINWGFDIAGFSGELPSRELYYRANQLAVFTPIMQVHSEPVGGQFSTVDPIRAFNNERTIWNMAKDDKKMLNDIRKLYYLRMNLLPYIYSEYLKAINSKTTLMKHMNIDYVGEYNENQYIFGELIVNPVLDAGVNTPTINLPDKQFYNIFTGEKTDNNLIENNTAIDCMFVYIESGKAIVSKQENLFEQTDNLIDSKKLYIHMYGKYGEYRYLDDNNDFTVVWNNKKVSVNSETKIELHYIFNE